MATVVFIPLCKHKYQVGENIKKVECANHACKCYRGSLEKLVDGKSAYKGRGGLTAKMRQRLTSAARCAIKMRSKELNRAEAIKKLEADLRNGPLHCFGVHDKCSPDFCTTARERQYSEATAECDERFCESDLSGVASDEVSHTNYVCTYNITIYVQYRLHTGRMLQMTVRQLRWKQEEVGPQHPHL